MGEKNLLDAEELLHLAIEASNKDDNEKSISLLKQALDIDPKNAKVQYMLGAMHAQIGIYDRAIEDMQKAVELDPKLDTAHFQLGLLYITSGNVPAAEQAWSALDSRGEQNPLFLFKRGILNLAQDKFEECINDLQQGIKINVANKPLNKDMQMLIAQAQDALKQNKPDDTPKPGSKESHVLLSAYDSEND
jgi:tetratricopeptide (TPR) repeat protein